MECLKIHSYLSVKNKLVRLFPFQIKGIQDTELMNKLIHDTPKILFNKQTYDRYM